MMTEMTIFQQLLPNLALYHFQQCKTRRYGGKHGCLHYMTLIQQAFVTLDFHPFASPLRNPIR